MKVDIIIPVKRINHYIRESIPRIMELDYDDYGIMVLPDAEDGESFPKTRIIATGNIGPAEKRDLALVHSRGDLFAFLDDDAYPCKDWLRKAVRHFADPAVAAVGGPAITPSEDSFWQRVSGAVFLSRLGGGNPERYRPVGGVRDVDDWPSVNLLVRRSVFEDVGGFSSLYWPGEDTKLCLDIIRRGGRIVYDPEAFVWHHRRGGLMRHLRQAGRYGLHRGFFARVFPETSRKFKYFVPSLFTLFLFAGVPLLFTGGGLAERLYLAGVAAYLLAVAGASLEIFRIEKSLAVSFMGAVYIFLTHVWYGARFLQGFLLTRDLKSKLRKTA